MLLEQTRASTVRLGKIRYAGTRLIADAADTTTRRIVDIPGIGVGRLQLGSAGKALLRLEDHCVVKGLGIRFLERPLACQWIDHATGIGDIRTSIIQCARRI